MNRLINANKLADFANNQKDKRIDANDIARFPSAPALLIPDTGVGDVSDGYHTFNELYHHRAVLFSVICNMHPTLCWKSKRHYEGDMYDDMFIVGIDTPKGPATYHYNIDPYWDLFKVKEYDRAPQWDGHTPDDAIERLKSLCFEYPALPESEEVSIKSQLISDFSKYRYGTDDYLASGILENGIYLPKPKFVGLIERLMVDGQILNEHIITHAKVTDITKGERTETGIVMEIVDIARQLVSAYIDPTKPTKE